MAAGSGAPSVAILDLGGRPRFRLLASSVESLHKLVKASQDATYDTNHIHAAVVQIFPFM